MSAKRSKPSYTREQLPRIARWDLAKMRRMTEEDIMRTSPPELANLPDDFWDEAKLVWYGAKEPISLRVDQDILDWFRAQGPRYQSRMNAVLRHYMIGAKQGRGSRAKTKRGA